MEIQEVQRMINDHNAAVGQGAATQCGRQYIKRTVLYAGYLLSQSATDSLLSLVRLPSDNNIRFLANNILITSRPCSRPILEQVGGMGNTVRWRVTSIGSFEDKIWGATVIPVPESTRVFTENRPATIVLALRKSARPVDVINIRNWQPLSPEERHEFDTVVGEKVLLQIEEETRAKPQWQRPQRFNNNNKRKFTGYTDEMDVDPSPPSFSGPERYPQLEAPTAPAGHNGLTAHHHYRHHHQHQLPPKPPVSYRDENMPPAHHHHHHQHQPQPQQQPHHRYQHNHSANSRGRGGGRGNRGGGSYRGARGDRGGAGGGGRGRHRGSGAPYNYRSLDDSSMERNHPDAPLSASSYSLDGAGDTRRGSDAIGIGIGIGIGTGGHHVITNGNGNGNGNGTPGGGGAPGAGVRSRYHQDGALGGMGGMDDIQYT